MTDQIGYWAMVAVGFGFLIFVHELGHFLLAKLMGVRIIRFSLGFGPRLLGTNRHADEGDGGTDYCLCLIPFGGYVKMAGGEGMDEATGAPDEFPSKTPGQRALIVGAGPATSILAAVPLLLLLHVLGFQRPSSRVHQVVPETGAWKAGLKRGDLITGLRGQDETEWTEIHLYREVRLNSALQSHTGDIQVRIRRDDRTRVLDLTTSATGQLGIAARVVGSDEGYISNVVGHVPDDSRAAEAGIRPGCRILEAEGRTIRLWGDLEEVARDHPDESIRVRFETPDGQEQMAEIPIESETLVWPGVRTRRPARVGLVRPDFPAEQAGLQSEDVIRAVDGSPVRHWEDLEQAVLAVAPGAVVLDVARDGRVRPVRVTLEEGEMLGDVLGIARSDPVVTGFSPQHPAEAAGVRPGTRVRMASLPGQGGGRELKYSDDLRWPPQDRARDRIVLTFETRVEELDMTVAGVDADLETAPVVPPSNEARRVAMPMLPRKWGRLAFSPRMDKCRVVEPGNVLGALGQAFAETGRWLGYAGRSLWLLVRGKVSPKMISGPLMILRLSHYQAEAGWMHFVEFMVIITVHLGLINLVPFPILDGGHLAFLGLEKIRRKPLPEKVMASVMYTGMALLIALMLYVTWNDISRLAGLG
jgi:regulator of sigma E protease